MIIYMYYVTFSMLEDVFGHFIPLRYIKISIYKIYLKLKMKIIIIKNLEQFLTNDL